MTAHDCFSSLLLTTSPLSPPNYSVSHSIWKGFSHWYLYRVTDYFKLTDWKKTKLVFAKIPSSKFFEAWVRPTKTKKQHQQNIVLCLGWVFLWFLLLIFRVLFCSSYFCFFKPNHLSKILSCRLTEQDKMKVSVIQINSELCDIIGIDVFDFSHTVALKSMSSSRRL